MTGPIVLEFVGLVQLGSGHDMSGQDKLCYDLTGQDRSGQNS